MPHYEVKVKASRVLCVEAEDEKTALKKAASLGLLISLILDWDNYSMNIKCKLDESIRLHAKKIAKYKQRCE
jgi:hypothetical protein